MDEYLKLEYVGSPKIESSVFELSWFDPVLTLAAALIGVLVVFWQVGKQFKLNRNLQQQNAREKLWLDVYREIYQQVNKSSNAFIAANGFVNGVLSDVRLWKLEEFIGYPDSFSSRRSMMLMDYNTDISTQTIELLYILERYEIIRPELKIFRDAFNSGLHDVRNSGTKLFSLYLSVLPMDVPEDKVAEFGVGPYFHDVPTDIQLVGLENLSNEYMNYVDELACYVHDFQIESQNYLLGDLFDHRVPSRVPLNPDLIVISTDTDEKIQELERYFREETNWGLNTEEINNRVKAQYEKK